MSITNRLRVLKQEYQTYKDQAASAQEGMRKTQEAIRNLEAELDERKANKAKGKLREENKVKAKQAVEEMVKQVQQ